MRFFSCFLLSLLSCPGVLAPFIAHAQSEAAATPAPPATSVAAEAAPGDPPKPAPDPGKLDTVRLKDGSLYRGTLLEHNPAGRTLLLLHDGTQQSFEADAIAAVVPAGLVASSSTAPVAPASTPLTPALQDGWVRLRVHTSSGLRLFARKAGDGGFNEVCANDCETQLPAGPYEFQLRSVTGSVYESASMHDVDQSSRVDALLTSRRPARIVGGILLGGGVLTGAILLGRGLALRGDARDACDAGGEEVASACRSQADKVGRGHIIGGVVSALLSSIVGAILVSRHDRLNVNVEPEPIPLGAVQVPFEPAGPVDPNLRPVTFGPAFDEVQASLRAQESPIRACIQEIPATAEFRIAASGAIRSLHLYGDLEDAQRECLQQALQKLAFAAGSERAVSVDIQPALR